MQYPGDGLTAIVFFVCMLIIVVQWRRQVASLRRDATQRASEAATGRSQLHSALAEAQEHALSAAADRARLESALTAATVSTTTQQTAVQQIASELSERLLAQQTHAFEQTTLALQQRADAEVRGMREMFEQTSVERVQAQVGPLADTLARVASALDQTRALQAESSGRSCRLAASDFRSRDALRDASAAWITVLVTGAAVSPPMYDPVGLSSFTRITN